MYNYGKNLYYLEINMELKDYIDPIKLFNQWFDEAKKEEIRDPNAMQLATVSKKGIPSVRTVLLKEIIDGYFVENVNKHLTFVFI